MNIFKKFRAMLRLREAIKKANEAYAKENHRFYVIPTSDGNLAVIDRKNFRIFKKKHYVAQDARVFHMLRECFYFTPCANGNDPITEFLRKKKVHQYFQWCDAFAKSRKKK